MALHNYQSCQQQFSTPEIKNQKKKKEEFHLQLSTSLIFIFYKVHILILRGYLKPCVSYFGVLFSYHPHVQYNCIFAIPTPTQILCVLYNFRGIEEVKKIKKK